MNYLWGKIISLQQNKIGLVHILCLRITLFIDKIFINTLNTFNTNIPITYLLAKTKCDLQKYTQNSLVLRAGSNHYTVAQQ